MNGSEEEMFSVYGVVRSDQKETPNSFGKVPS